ncbi:MAG: DMT family transporter [Acidobacteria bacterium]|nr:DMT family transporter [Acidobacteriota bacterium]
MKHRLLVLSAALLFSTGGAAIKAISLSSWQVASIRSLIAAIALLALVPESRRGWTPQVWLTSLGYAATLVLFVLANRLTTSANAIFLQATAPFFLLLIGPLVLQEKNTARDYALGLAVAMGMSLFFVNAPGASALAPNPALGNVLAGITGLTWALTITGLRRMGAGNLPVVATGNLAAFALALPAAWPIPEVTAADAGALLYLGVIQIGLAYYCLTNGVQKVPAFETSALMLLEPAMNPVWTFVLHGERPGPFALAGGAIIVLATLAHTLRRT